MELQVRGSFKKAITTGLIVALLTVCPLASRAADYAFDSHQESAAPSAAGECPVAKPAGSADCAGNGVGQRATTIVMTRAPEGDREADSGTNDASGRLLEGLVNKAPKPDDKEL